jgi:hypothetical protein
LANTGRPSAISASKLSATAADAVKITAKTVRIPIGIPKELLKPKPIDSKGLQRQNRLLPLLPINPYA